MKKILKYILIYFVVLIILAVTLIIVDCIPHKYVKDNVEKSVHVFLEEGYFPKVKLAAKFLLDNYSDSIMMGTAYSIDENKPIESSMLMRRYYRPGDDQVLADDNAEDKPIPFLEQTINGINDTYMEYSRYWHGYIVLLRPLLVLFNYSQIRIILTLVICILALILVFLTYKRLGIYYTIFISIILLLFQFWSIGLSLFISLMFLLMLTASIYILIKGKSIKNIGIVFFIIGMLTSFFDLYSVPIITLGIPLLFYCILNNQENTIKKILEIIVLWFIGYGSMWIGKWVISDLICNTNTIKNALEKVFWYTKETTFVNVNFVQALLANYGFLSVSLCVLLPITIASLVYMILTKKTNKNVLIYCIIAIVPIAWLVFGKNHSFIHARFTFRNLFVSEFAMLCILYETIKQKTKLITDGSSSENS